MSRSLRPVQWLLPLVLIASTLFVVRPHAVSAATFTYYVDSALDLSLTDTPSACPAGEQNAFNKNCTLRQALERAEGDGDTSEVQFIIPSSADPDYGYDSAAAAWVIRPTENLPALGAGNTTLTGRLNGLGLPRIVLDGASVPITDAVGLNISSAQNRVAALTVINFGLGSTTSAGMLISGSTATSNTLVGNYIGIRPGATSASPNGGAGIRIEGGAGATLIGGSTLPGTRNVIAGNSGDGISISGGSGNTIQGNLIGVALNNAFVLAPFGNTGMGLRITNSSSNLIGGDQSTLANTISANKQAGVLITGSGSQQNILAGNAIGTDDTGTQGMGNTQDGVQILSGARNNNVSGTPTARCLISGNGRHGVTIAGTGAEQNRVFGCYVGLADDGLNAIPNAQDGLISQNGAANNQFGLPEQGNVVAGNGRYGITLGPPSTTLRPSPSNSAQANLIGLGADGVAVIPNGKGGIMIAPNGADTLISANVIANNGGPAITITGTQTLSTTIIGNLIGLRRDAQGNFTLAGSNAGAGISIDGTVGLTRIGGSSSEGNTIVASVGNGIELRGSGVQSTTIAANLIGALRNNDTLTPLPNTGTGIAIAAGARTTTISDTTVAFHGADGIALDGADTTTLSGVSVISNTLNGIALTNSQTTTLQFSQILSNTLVGVAAISSTDTTIFSTTLTANGQDGVRVAGDSLGVRISQSIVRSNGGYGVLITDTAQRVTVRDNQMTRNLAGGVRLTPQTNPVGAPGNATHPNHDIDPPVTDTASPLRARLSGAGVLSGYVLTDTLQCVSCTIQFYAADPSLPTPDGQGFVKLGETNAAADGSFSITLGDPASLPTQILLMAIDGTGNSSEYGIFTRILRLNIGPPRSASAQPGETIVYSHRVTNTGTVDLTDLVLTATGERDPGGRAWTFVVEPDRAFTLQANESIPVTLTVTLPIGSDERATPSPPDERTVLSVASDTTPGVSARVTDTTTVLPVTQVMIAALSDHATTPPEGTATYSYAITNSGNIVAAIAITPTINLPGWQVESSATSVNLAPGASVTLNVTVRVPQGAQAGVKAQTLVQVRVAEDATQSRVFTATTTVALVQNGDLVPEYDETVTAGQTIPLRHTVENRSNGSAAFRLSYSAEFSSTVLFTPAVGGVIIDANNIFTLTNTLGNNFFSFDAEVVVDERLLPNQTEVIRIFLSDASGNVVYQTVVDRLRVIKANIKPRIWLPTMVR